MRLPNRFHRRKGNLGRALVLGGLLLLTAGCTTLANAKIGFTGTDETKPLTGPRSQ